MTSSKVIGDLQRLGINRSQLESPGKRSDSNPNKAHNIHGVLSTRFLDQGATSRVTIVGTYLCHGQKSRSFGDGHPTFNRNPYNGYINPYYWVDDHPLLYGNNGSLDPGTFVLCLLGLNPSKEGLFQSKQWSFGFQVVGI